MNQTKNYKRLVVFKVNQTTCTRHRFDLVYVFIIHYVILHWIETIEIIRLFLHRDVGKQLGPHKRSKSAQKANTPVTTCQTSCGKSSSSKFDYDNLH